MPAWQELCYENGEAQSLCTSELPFGLAGRLGADSGEFWCTDAIHSFCLTPSILVKAVKASKHGSGRRLLNACNFDITAP